MRACLSNGDTHLLKNHIDQDKKINDKHSRMEQARPYASIHHRIWIVMIHSSKSIARLRVFKSDILAYISLIYSLINSNTSTKLYEGISFIRELSHFLIYNLAYNLSMASATGWFLVNFDVLLAYILLTFLQVKAVYSIQ